MKIQTSIFNIVCYFTLVLYTQKWGVESVLSNHRIEKNNLTTSAQPISFKQLPTFGLGNLFANYDFIRFLLYFGDENLRDTGYVQSPQLLETVISRDPYFMDFYLFLSESTTIHAGNPNKTIELIDKGISLIDGKYPVDGYRIWRYKGIDELLFLGDASAAQKSYREAGHVAIESTDPAIQAVGRRSLQTALFLSENPDSKQARISAWASLISTTLNDEARQRAVDEIEALGGEVIFKERGGVSIKYEPSVQHHDEEDSET